MVTGRAFNKGLRGYLGNEELTPREIDAATQAFVIPAGRSGDFRMTFSAQPVYRATLLFGGALGLLALGLCILAATRRRPTHLARAAARCLGRGRTRRAGPDRLAGRGGDRCRLVGGALDYHPARLPRVRCRGCGRGHPCPRAVDIGILCGRFAPA